MIISIDFDGTICRDEYPEIGAAMPYAIDVIKELKEQGHILILNTCREGNLLINAVNWLLDHNLVFNRINDNLNEISIKYGSNARKVFADVYIDDRNFGGFPGWLTIQKRLNEQG